jgi:hypothetical protein
VAARRAAPGEAATIVPSVRAMIVDRFMGDGMN